MTQTLDPLYRRLQNELTNLLPEATITSFSEEDAPNRRDLTTTVVRFTLPGATKEAQYTPRIGITGDNAFTFPPENAELYQSALGLAQARRHLEHALRSIEKAQKCGAGHLPDQMRKNLVYIHNFLTGAKSQLK